MIDEYSYGIIKLQNGSPDWLRKFSLIPDEDERSHYVVYANVSQMLSQWIMIKMTLKGGGGDFIDDYHSSLKLMLFWIKSYYNIKSTRYNKNEQ